MITVTTCRKVDYQALLKAGMSKTQKPTSIKHTDNASFIKFEVSDDIFIKLDLDNNNSLTIMCLDGIPSHLRA